MTDSMPISSARQIGEFLNGGRLSRILPEPRSRIGSTFGAVLQGVGKAVSGASSAVSIDPEYRDLIETQMEFQRQMQLVSLHSNIEKSRHEAKMAAIRNVRSG